MRPINRRERDQAFTLVELLVVIGIIGLLISILLPSLSKARHAANTIKCLANERSILQGLQLYAAQNNGYIPGPNTSGWFLWAGGDSDGAYSDTNAPGIVAAWDWMSPILQAQGIGIHYSPGADPDRSNAQARLDRMNFELTFGEFVCPENQAVCTLYAPTVAFPGLTTPAVIPYQSYCIPINFCAVQEAQMLHNQGFYAATYELVPSGYIPKLSKVGATARKIFVADGGPYLTNFNNSFDENYEYNAKGSGGAYAAYGPYVAWDYNYAFGRGHAPGNGETGPASQDERVLWARHGSGIPGGAANTFRFNAGFFDGHAETLGDLEGANPSFWSPKGSQIAGTEFEKDVLMQYNNNNSAQTFVVSE